jgi:hypothetical protein
MVTEVRPIADMLAAYEREHEFARLVYAAGRRTQLVALSGPPSPQWFPMVLIP